MSNSSLIITKIDQFIRKYYKNRLIRGVLYAASLLLSLYLLIVLLEHFGYFGVGVRTAMFWLYLLLFVLLLAFYVVTPLLKMYRFGRCISHEQAAQIIGTHFPEIKDKLLNLLQLQSMGDAADSDLLAAAIEQKAAQLSPIPFVNAVNLKGNRKYLKFVLIPAAVLLLLLIASPAVVRDSSKRLLHHTETFERPAPFAFVVDNDSLCVVQQHDLLLSVSVEGNTVPNEAYVCADGLRYRMQKVDNAHFTYLFKTLRSSFDFHLEGGGVTSSTYTLQVLPSPTVLDFQVVLNYPAYTRRADETLSNVGDLTVPEGTRVQWLFQTQDVDTLAFLLGDLYRPLLPNRNGRVSYALRALQSADYAFFAANSYIASSDTVAYFLSVVPDALPLIAVAEMQDSLSPDRLFFKGRIKDDYGFTRLEFHVERSNAADTTTQLIVKESVAFSDQLSQEFYFSANMEAIEVFPGDRISYYFEVWDNDAIHGPKSARSQLFQIEIPTEEELDNLLEDNREDIHQSGQTSLSELKKLQQEIQEMMRKLVDKSDLTWQDKRELEELSKKQKEVKDMLQQMQQQIQENNRLEQKYREQSEEILEKQKELDRLIDELMSEEMKEMMKQIDQMLKETDKQKLQEQLENLNLKNEDLSKQLDQDLELMHRLELEKRVEEVIQKADKLAEEQKKLSQQTEQAKGKDKEMLLEKQQQLNKDFQDIKKELDKLKQEYKQLDPSSEFKPSQELQQRIEQEQNNAQNQLQKGKNSDASQQQKSAAEDLEKLSEQIAEAQMEMEQQDLAEDSETVRRLLKNVVRLSFNQESLISTINGIYIQDPKYQQVIVDQNKISDDFRNVEDSLRAMAKRQVAVASVINKELAAINSNMSKTLGGLLQFNQSFYGNSRNTGSARYMQSTMTSLNNLALVMAESLDQMQNQMRQNEQKQKQGSCKRKCNKPNSGQCSKPGQGKPSPKSMKQMQEQLNKQMEALRKELEKQGSKPDQQGKQGRAKIGQGNQFSEEFARMAAQQEQIRRMMQEYGQEMKQQSAGNAKLAKEIDEMVRQMEQTETDLVNKTITQQTIRRQQQIMSRMLEHEKADLQREKEERRQSKEAKDFYQPSQQELQQYQQLKEKNLELFQTTPPNLNNYYKRKVSGYFFRF